MSLLKSLDSAVSGLNAFQTKMDVIGDNIANVDTTGFKSSDVSFADALSQTVSSGSGSEDAPTSGAQVGLGVRVAAINKDFSQGSLQSTGKNTDLAVKGDGFFMIDKGGESYLTRNGNFDFNKDGFFVDHNGNKVQGYNANGDGQILSGSSTDDIRLDFNQTSQPKATQNLYVAGNLDSGTSKNQIAQAQLAFTTSSGAVATGATDINNLSQTSAPLGSGSTLTFNLSKNDGTAQALTFNYGAGSDGTTLNDLVTKINSDLSSNSVNANASLVDGLLIFRSTQPGDSQLKVNTVNESGPGSVNIPSFKITQEGQTNSQNVSSTVYDGLGNAHTLVMKLTQSDTNTWNYEARFLDGESLTGGNDTGTLTFDKSGNLNQVNGTNDSALSLTFDPGSGAQSQTFSVNLGDPANGSKITQFSGTSSAQVASQDGYQQGKLTGFHIDGSGNINGRYSNGRTAKLAQIAIGDVANHEGLESKGDGLYRKTEASGEITQKTASDIANTSLSSGVLEGSNVDLAHQFTDMISTQRAYQSNARVITTSDQLLQEAVNLKR